MDSDEIFMVLVIVVPILLLLGAIFLCCWCCQCCCCAKPPQQVVVYPANPNNTVVNTTLMNPYNQGYTPLPAGFSPSSNQGIVAQYYAPQQHQQFPQTSAQYPQQGHSSGYQRSPNDHLLLSDCPTRGYQNEHVDPSPHGYQTASTSMTTGKSNSDGFQEDRTAMPYEYAKPPPYSSLH